MRRRARSAHAAGALLGCLSVAPLKHLSYAALIQAPRRGLSPEDRAIWLRVCCSRVPMGPSPCAWHEATLADTQSYILMLQAQMIARFGPAAIELEGVAVRGWSLQQVEQPRPRLEVEPLTDEDRAAWFDWQVNRSRDLRLWGALERVSFASDRADAALMWSMMGAAAALGASTHERRNLLAFYFGDPYVGCRLFE